MAIVQFRVEDELKDIAVEVFEKLGLDLSTALRMFLRKCVMTDGIPFDLINVDEPYKATKALEILDRLSKESEINGNSDITLDEINEIIRQVRKERKNK